MRRGVQSQSAYLSFSTCMSESKESMWYRSKAQTNAAFRIKAVCTLGTPNNTTNVFI